MIKMFLYPNVSNRPYNYQVLSIYQLIAPTQSSPLV